MSPLHQCLGGRSVAKWLQTLQWHFPCSEAAVAKHGSFLSAAKLPLPPGKHRSMSNREAGGQQTGQARGYWLSELVGNFLSKWKQKLSISIYAVLFLLGNKKLPQGRLLQFSAKIFKFWVIKSKFSMKKKRNFFSNTVLPGICTEILPANCFHTKTSPNSEWCTEYSATTRV